MWVVLAILVMVVVVIKSLFSKKVTYTRFLSTRLTNPGCFARNRYY